MELDKLDIVQHIKLKGRLHCAKTLGRMVHSQEEGFRRAKRSELVPTKVSCLPVRLPYCIAFAASEFHRLDGDLSNDFESVVNLARP